MKNFLYSNRNVIRIFYLFACLISVLLASNCNDSEVSEIDQSVSRFNTTLVQAQQVTEELQKSDKIAKSKIEILYLSIEKMESDASNLKNFLEEVHEKKKSNIDDDDRAKITTFFTRLVNSTVQFKETIPEELVADYQPLVKKFSEELKFGINKLDCKPIDDKCVRCKPSEVICNL